MSGDKHQFISEDESAGYASPLMDIVAAAALVALSAWIIVEAVALDVPDSIATAPGLLPIIVAGSLAAMALALGVLAWRRRAAGIVAAAADEPTDVTRTILLIVFLVVYVAALELIPFNFEFNAGSYLLSIGGFEVISIVVLSAIFRVFWTNQLILCLTASTLWIALLSIAFKHVFEIPLPGSG
ncbi:MAG: tripartite tricarboxylate transporter TctB family protein [Hyphomicrobiaceae bacterium]